MFGSAVIRAALPYLVAIAIVFGALFGAYRFGVHNEHLARVAEVAELQGEHGEEMRILDKAHTDALEVEFKRRIDAEAKHAEDMAAIDAQYTKEKTDAKNKSEAAIAAVRSGAIRVREQFTCAPNAGSPSGAGNAPSTSTSVGDGIKGGGLRAEDAELVLRIADEADTVVRQLSACQAIVRRDRGQ